ncbi:hypothetical protein HYE67_009809 [Fusarium culmorum]|uniref:Uncharacterized protein n=1 Tax=Fusarium culmorum TaxID=5516 RepID=A0A2T4H9P7_FUSCU|nr:hypothetical protein FCULG_00004745 [Fusarium culmorum]QPC67578.1 hypothetical protein HYE67_009809 [Fusarium culmorum]
MSHSGAPKMPAYLIHTCTSHRHSHDHRDQSLTLNLPKENSTTENSPPDRHRLQAGVTSIAETLRRARIKTGVSKISKCG